MGSSKHKIYWVVIVPCKSGVGKIIETKQCWFCIAEIDELGKTECINLKWFSGSQSFSSILESSLIFFRPKANLWWGP